MTPAEHRDWELYAAGLSFTPVPEDESDWLACRRAWEGKVQRKRNAEQRGDAVLVAALTAELEQDLVAHMARQAARHPEVSE